jgi:hypothetical protein
MSFKLIFLNHASFLIETTESITLVDPWYFGKIFNNSWSLLQDTDDSKIDYSKLKYISISHEHPDHLHWPTLKHIRSKSSNNICILYPKRTNPNVMNECLKLGFSFKYVDFFIEHKIENDFFITPFPAGHDSALVYRIHDKIVCNQNDAYLDSKVLKSIQRMFPRIDIWLFQYSLAGYYGNFTEPRDIYENGTRYHMSRFLFYQKSLNPEISIPFASFVYFCKKYNNYLNRYSVKLSHLLPLSKRKILVPFYGQELSEFNNSDNINKFENLFEASKKNILPLSSFPGETLFCELLYDLAKIGFKLKKKIIIEFFDYEKSLFIDTHDLKFDFLSNDEVNEDIVAVKLPSEELVNYLKTPWGGDTLNITGCFLVKNKQLWQNLLEARENLYIR